MPRKKSQPPAAETNGVNSGALEMVSFTVTVDTDTEAGRRIIAALRNNPDPGALILAGLDAAPSPTPPSPDTSIKELVDALRVFISDCIRESITTLYAERDAAENAEIAESYRKRAAPRQSQRIAITTRERVLFMKKLLLSVLLGISLAILISHCGMNSSVSSPHRRMGDELEIAERMF